MDIFTLVQTCKKLGISHAYLRDRLCRRYQLPSLGDQILLAGSD